MGMDKIIGSPLSQPGALDKFQGTGRSEKKETSATEQGLGGETPNVANQGDKAEISATAHRLMDLRQAVDTGRTAIAGLPELRENKLAEARERLASGYYQSDEVQEELAAKLDGVFRKMDAL